MMSSTLVLLYSSAINIDFTCFVNQSPGQRVTVIQIQSHNHWGSGLFCNIATLLAEEDWAPTNNRLSCQAERARGVKSSYSQPSAPGCILSARAGAGWEGKLGWRPWPTPDESQEGGWQVAATGCWGEHNHLHDWMRLLQHQTGGGGGRHPVIRIVSHCQSLGRISATMFYDLFSLCFKSLTFFGWLSFYLACFYYNNSSLLFCTFCTVVQCQCTENKINLITYRSCAQHYSALPLSTVERAGREKKV